MRVLVENWWLNTAPEYIWKTAWIKFYKQKYLAAKWAYAVRIFGISITLVSSKLKDA